MIRALLSLLLLAALGAVGFYFWSAQTHGDPAVYRARVEPHQPPMTAPRSVPALPDSPSVDTGRGAAQAQVPQASVQGAASLGTLGNRHLGLPVTDLTPGNLIDTFDQARDGGERRHEATDILAPRGTPVMAVDDGVIRKLFSSIPGGTTIYQYEPGEQYCYYYAHLDRYAEGLHEGQQVRRGDVIGYVGTTGNADPNTPHLHFAILELGPQKEWWRETRPVNAYPILMSAITASRTR